jgi:hypothetical protein
MEYENELQFVSAICLLLRGHNGLKPHQIKQNLMNFDLPRTDMSLDSLIRVIMYNLEERGIVYRKDDCYYI